ncbi:MAG: META domain-containing protein [Shimia sp.]|uniref:META domain-containing protein n=1 Tax=Shimia sp. TaxID=1954381 RepID=UPI004058491C
MKYLLPLVGLLALAGCGRDETLTQYGGDAFPWRLLVLDGKPVSFPNEIAFGPRGSVTGFGPCSTYSARQTAPYPWFALEDVQVVEVTQDCAYLAQEAAYFAALSEMSLSEVSGSELVLSDDTGREMVFTGVSYAQ